MQNAGLLSRMSQVRFLPGEPISPPSAATDEANAETLPEVSRRVAGLKFQQVCGLVSEAPAREAGEAGANPAHLTNLRGVAKQSKAARCKHAGRPTLAGANPASSTNFLPVVKPESRGRAKAEPQV